MHLTTGLDTLDNSHYDVYTANNLQRTKRTIVRYSDNKITSLRYNEDNCTQHERKLIGCIALPVIMQPLRA